MRMKLVSFVALLLATGVTGAPFINLDFELADLTGSQLEYRVGGSIAGFGTNFPFGTGPVEKLLPGWQVFYGNSVTNLMAIGNSFFTATSIVSPGRASLLVEGDYYLGAFVTNSGWEGRYALYLENLGRPPWASVRQTGEVPADARWLTFRLLGGDAYVGIDNRDFLISRLAWDPIDSRQRYLDISDWAGETVTLSFSAPEASFSVDSIAFVIPEPSTWALLGLGAVLLMIAARREWMRVRKGPP